MMRILHIYKNYPPVIGGIENHLGILAEAQAERGHEVTVLVTSRDGRTSEEFSRGVRVIRAARLAETASTPLSLELFRRVRNLEPEITHLQFPYPPGEMAYLAWGSGKLVISYHSDIVRQRLILLFYRPLLERVLDRADRIIATSRAYLESSTWLKSRKEKCRIVPLAPGLPASPEADPVAAEIIKARFGDPLLLFVGRLRYYKGIPYLLRAVRGLNVHLIIAGEGPYGEQWRKLSGELGVEDRVHFFGEVSEREKRALYGACDLFVLPSSHRSEAFGLVLLEAMAFGKPVISTELGTGTSFVNRHERTGLVVPPRDPEALRESIQRLVRDPELRREMGENGRKRVLREFTVDRMVTGVEGVYRELVERR